MSPLEAWFHLNLIAGIALFGTVEPWSQAAMELSWYALAIAGLIRGRLRADAVPPLAVGCAGVAVLAAWQAAATPAQTASVWATRGAVRLWVMYACAASSAAALIATRGALRRALLVVFVTALGVAVEGLLQKGRPDHAIYGLRPAASAFGPFYNRDHAAGCMAAGAALGLGLIAAGVARFTARRRSVGRMADLWAGQIILAVLVGSLGAGMAAAGSRGATHGLLAGAGVVLYLGARRFAAGAARRALLVGVLVAGAAYAGLVTALPKFAGWVEAERAFDASTQARFAIWRLSLGMARMKPALGWGVGAYRFAFGPVQAGEPVLAAGQVQHAHGDWLQFLVEGGALGFLLVVLPLAWQLRRQILEWRRDHDLEVWGLLGGAVAAVLTLIVHGVVDFDLQIPGLMVLFVSVGSFFYPLRPVRPFPSLISFPYFFPRFLSKLPALFVVGVLLVCGLRAARSLDAWRLAQAALAQDAPGRVTLLARALTRDPGNPGAARNLGVAYLWLGDEYASASLIYAMKARDTATTALALTPDEPGLLELKGVALARLGRRAEARAALARARMLQPWAK